MEPKPNERLQRPLDICSSNNVYSLSPFIIMPRHNNNGFAFISEARDCEHITKHKLSFDSRLKAAMTVSVCVASLI